MLKQLFCQHIWKLISKDLLYKTEGFNYLFYKNWGENHYATTWQCVKCGKKKVEERTSSYWLS